MWPTIPTMAVPSRSSAVVEAGEVDYTTSGMDGIADGAGGVHPRGDVWVRRNQVAALEAKGWAVTDSPVNHDTLVVVTRK